MRENCLMTSGIVVTLDPVPRVKGVIVLGVKAPFGGVRVTFAL